MNSEMINFKSNLLTLMNLFQASGDKTLEGIMWDLVKRFGKIEDSFKGGK